MKLSLVLLFAAACLLLVSSVSAYGGHGHGGGGCAQGAAVLAVHAKQYFLLTAPSQLLASVPCFEYVTYSCAPRGLATSRKGPQDALYH